MSKDFVIGVLGGLASSVVWVALLRFVRPRIDIAPTIAQWDDGNANDPIFRFKVVNRGRMDAISVRVELDRVRTEEGLGGRVEFTKRLTLNRSELLLLPRYKKRDKDCRYAIRFTSQDPLLLWLAEGTYKLRFTVFAQNSVSGVAHTCRTEFLTPECVICGTFKDGRDLKIHRSEAVS